MTSTTGTHTRPECDPVLKLERTMNCDPGSDTLEHLRGKNADDERCLRRTTLYSPHSTSL